MQLTWGVYTPRGLDPHDRYLLKCRSVLQRMQPSAALAGPSSAAVWDLPLLGRPPEKVYICNVPRGTYARDVCVLPESATQEVDGLNIASPVDTVMHCSRLLSSRDGLIVADATLAAGLCSLADLRAAAESRKGRPGASRARWVAQNADPLAESPGETWTRSIVRQLGYEVRSQVHVTNGSREAWLDFLIVDGQTAIEFDGLTKYRNRGLAKVIQQHLRDGDLQAMGLTVLHVIWSQLHNPWQLHKRLQSAGELPVRQPRLLTW